MLWAFLKALTLADVLDIVLVATLVYALLVWFKRAKAAFVAIGILVFASIYFISRVTGMVMTAWLLHSFFAALVVVLIVIFQEELRSIFERIAIWSLKGPSGVEAASPKEIQTLVSTLGELAQARIGALIVLRGHDPMDRHVEGGWNLNGEVSEALIKSIFDSHSIGHDGAMLIDRGRVARFGCQLPLSRSFEKTTNMGTRHRAALGLCELSDALCLAVSEEKGTVSVARDGAIVTVRDLSELAARIEDFVMEKAPPPEKDRLRAFLRHNTREKAIALAASVLVWAVTVMGAKPWRRAYDVPVFARNVPSSLRVVSIQPSSVQVTLSGLMREFYWMERRRLVVRVEVPRPKPGRLWVPIYERDISRPAGLIPDDVEPAGVEVELAEEQPRR